MGCDIHPYVEYFDLDRPDEQAWSMCQPELGRDYLMFSVLAGVRGESDFMVSSPKGLPDLPPMGFDAAVASRLLVTDDKDMARWEMHCVDHEHAEDYLKRGISQIIKRDEKDFIITHPDWHSHSWYFLDEMYQVRVGYMKEQLLQGTPPGWRKVDAEKCWRLLHELSPEDLMKMNFTCLESVGLNVAIASMMAIEKTNPRLKSRIVFWFDS